LSRIVVTCKPTYIKAEREREREVLCGLTVRDDVPGACGGESIVAIEAAQPAERVRPGWRKQWRSLPPSTLALYVTHTPTHFLTQTHTHTRYSVVQSEWYAVDRKHLRRLDVSTGSTCLQHPLHLLVTSSNTVLPVSPMQCNASPPSQPVNSYSIRAVTKTHQQHQKQHT
jgi:hypothetical protein